MVAELYLDIDGLAAFGHDLNIEDAELVALVLTAQVRVDEIDIRELLRWQAGGSRQKVGENIQVIFVTKDRLKDDIAPR